jgi:hypothetical protein
MDPRQSRHPADRRIDDRVPVDGLDLRWGLRTRRWRGQGAPGSARVLNLSRGGMLALVPRSRLLRAGLEVPVELCGGSGTVRVTHVRPSARRGWRLCGLDLVDGDLQLLDAIERIIEEPTGQYAKVWANVH